MKNIIDIYKEYKITPFLMKHQMRVAAVAMQICESLDIDIETENVVKACLLHDMGNIVKFDLDHFPEQNEPEGREYWQKIKDEYIDKYGNNEHKATTLIAEELGIPPRILELINDINSSSINILVADGDFNKKIILYADSRVNPYEVVSIEERSREVKERYKDHPYAFNEESRLFFVKNLYLIEKQIFFHSSIKPEDINGESIKIYLEKLQDFSI